MTQKIMPLFLATLMVVGCVTMTPETAPASQDATASATQKREQSDVARIESYLNNLKTLKARFIQTGADGNQAAGTFYLNRPGKLRFEYDDPVDDFIVADGMFIYFYDSQMKSQSSTTISNSLADFLLRENLSLSGDITVSDIEKTPDGKMILATLTQTSDPDAGSLTLGLLRKPDLQLKKWRVVDAQGGVTEVELFDIETGLKLDKDLFYYRDPEHTKPRYN